MKLLSATLALLVTSSAFAGLLIEPYVGYASLKGSGTANVIGLGEGEIEETTAKGVAYGGRLGYGVGPIGAGVDFMTSSLDDDGDDTKLTNLGAFAAVGLGPVRFWGTYIFSSKYELTSGDFDGTAFEGAGVKAGLGWQILPLLSLNLEYMALNQDEVEESDVLDEIDFDQKGFMISISIPFVI